jgi:defect-in-organelle-trafficking protein DotC
MRSQRRSALLCSVALLIGLTGCADNMPVVNPPDASGVSVNVNNNQSFFPDQTADDQGNAMVPLAQMEALHAETDETPAQQAQTLLFMPAMRDAALKYGVEGGLAFSTNLVNSVLRQDDEALSKTYDFTRIVTYEPGGAMILPPVISQSVDTYQESDFGQQIRVANNTYDIIREAQFAPNTPLWYSYLYRPWTAPDAPPQSALPKTDEERKAWVQYVDEGWQDGVAQGLMNFKLDLAQLNQDFVGMVRYRTLYDAGKVSAPVVQNEYLGTTGTGQTMREGDRVEKIIAEPQLDVPSQPGPGDGQ